MSKDRSITRRDFGKGFAAALFSAAIARRADAQCSLTTSDALGPYYLTGAPSRSVIASADEPGTRLFITGTVFGSNCVTPLGGTIVDAWQASNAGCYSRSQVCPDEDPWNLRGQMLTGPNGEFALETILPGYYTGRCRHIHWRFAPISGPVLVTQLYFQGDPQIPNDPLASQPSAANRIIPLTQEADGLHGVFDIALNVSATDVGDEGYDPEITYLHTGYPNPFQTSTIIRFSLARPGRVELAVYDVTGRRVRDLLTTEKGVGYHTADWDGRDNAGRAIQPGVYFCRLVASGGTQTRRLVRAS
jgi:catechol 1,2-dioxygenase